MAATTATTEVHNEPKSPSRSIGLSDTLAALAELDRLLDYYLAAVSRTVSIDPNLDSCRGLYIDRDDVKELIEYSPGTSPLTINDNVEDGSALTGLTTLRRFAAVAARMFRLMPFDSGAVLIALTPDMDPRRFERIYACLRDDMTRKRPTVDMAFSLLCGGPEDKLIRLAHFSADAKILGGSN